MAEKRASRRDLFKLFGESLAEFVKESGAAGAARAASEAFEAAEKPAPRAAPSPFTEVPVEEGRMVIDLAAFPVPVAKGRRFRAPGWAGTVLVVRVSADHFAAVGADCPHCGGALIFDVPLDAVTCPRKAVAFRMDGRPVRGPRDLRVPVYVCRAAGPRLEIEPAAFNGYPPFANKK